MVYGKYCGNSLLYVTQYGGNIKNYEDGEGSQAVIVNNTSAKI